LREVVQVFKGIDAAKAACHGKSDLLADVAVAETWVALAKDTLAQVLQSCADGIFALTFDLELESTDAFFEQMSKMYQRRVMDRFPSVSVVYADKTASSELQIALKEQRSIIDVAKLSLSETTRMDAAEKLAGVLRVAVHLLSCKWWLHQSVKFQSIFRTLAGDVCAFCMREKDAIVTILATRGITPEGLGSLQNIAAASTLPDDVLQGILTLKAILADGAFAARVEKLASTLLYPSEFFKDHGLKASMGIN
jgi:hypothetical protein